MVRLGDPDAAARTVLAALSRADTDSAVFEVPELGERAAPQQARVLRLVTGASNHHPGQTLGRYELVQPIARGGMAVVWAALDPAGGRVAIKTVLPHLRHDAHFQLMFRRETELAARLDHPNVCKVLDHGSDAGVDFIVMEWMEGAALSALLGSAGALPLGVAVRIALDVARGLGAAHELVGSDGERLGLVHRDVSPENVLLSSSGVAKIADFGIAKATQAAAALTQCGSIKGKAAYFSPEQAFSEPLDARSDVFALGAVLYEMTTGRRPFGADSLLASLVKLTSPEPVPGPDQWIPDFPRALSAVIARALDKDKSQRYPNMATFAEGLEAAGQGFEGTDHAHVAEVLRSLRRGPPARRFAAFWRPA